MLPTCDKRHADEMVEAMLKIDHPHIRAEFMKFWHKLPSLPIPKISVGNPTLFFFDENLWRVSIGRSGGPVFWMYTFFSWIPVSEEEFLGAFK